MISRLTRSCAAALLALGALAVPSAPAGAAPSSAACSRFSRATGWQGTITISFSRSATTPNYVETASGGMSYQVSVGLPVVPMGMNGYDETWVGRAQGSGHFHVDVTNADGSPLSRPSALDASGAVVDDPPLGKFGPEQFWINPDKCVYAIYTYGALNTHHSREADRIDGVAVHTEGIPLPATGNVLAGSHAFTLPNATNFYGGDQFLYPCVLVDWCNRGSGKATLTWSFSPISGGGSSGGGTTSTNGGAIRCPTRSGHSQSATSRIRNDLTTAFKNHGDAVTYQDVSVTGSIAAGTAKIEVRLGSGHHPLPSIECVDEAIANGSAGPSSQSGATQLVLGAIQQANGSTRVTVRVVDVSTGAIGRTGLGTATGTNDAAITAAAAAALQQLNVPLY